jgi:dihydrofolate reductase
MESILAIDSKNGLAKNGTIPWKSKKDMTFFK